MPKDAPPATRYTSAHWGVREVREDADGVTLHALADDPCPNAIGLDQLTPEVQSARVRRPAVRESWLRHGPGAAPEKRGHERFVEVDEETDRLAGDDVADDDGARDITQPVAGCGDRRVAEQFAEQVGDG